MFPSRRTASSYILFAAAAAFGLCPLQALESAPNPPGVSKKVSERSNRQWIALSGIMTFLRNTPLSAFSELPEDVDSRDCSSLYTSARKIVADLGYQFFKDNPDDPRRWTWLEFVLDDHLDEYLAMNYDIRTGLMRPRLPGEAQDEAQWKKRLASVESACLATASAPVNLRCRLRFDPMARKVSQATADAMRGRKKGVDIDWDELAREIDGVASMFPDANPKTLKDAAALVLKNSREFAPDGGDSILAEYRSSKNATLRGLVPASDPIAEAMKTPMEMRFVDVEGRKVDLAAMRGKVVLLDFRGISWNPEGAEEEPLLKSLYAKYHAKGFEIICITWEMTGSLRPRMIDYKKMHDLPWAFYFDGSFGNPYIRKFGFTVLPQYLFLDKNGLVVSHMASVRGLAKGDLEGLINKYLATAAPK
jgi:hypothetical protein